MAIVPVRRYVSGSIVASAYRTLFSDPEAWFHIGMSPANVGPGFVSRTPFRTAIVDAASAKDFANNALSYSSGQADAFHIGPPDLADQTNAMSFLVSQVFWLMSQSAPGVSPTWAQIKAYVLVTQPSQTTINDRVLLIADAYNFTSAFAAAGDTFEVEIDGATTFRWRVNGGAWTSLVPIATEITVGTYYTLYFLATTGFTIGRNWVWRRTDSFMETSNTAVGVLGSHCRAENDWIFVGPGGLIGRAYFGRSGATNGTTVVRSMGYRRIYGNLVAVFQKHLFVAGFTETAALLPSKGLVLGWSDLTDLDNMLATDVNEADTFTLTSLSSSVLREEQITNLVEWQNVLYIFTQTSIFRCVYVGLPNVMQIDKVVDGLGCICSNAAVATPFGIFFPAHDGMYRFDGSGFTNVSPGITHLWPDYTSATPNRFPQDEMLVTNGEGRGSYNPVTGQLCWVLGLVGVSNIKHMLFYDPRGQKWSMQAYSSAAIAQIFYKKGYPVIVGSSEIAVPWSTYDNLDAGNRPDEVLITNVFQHSSDAGKVLELQDLWVDVHLETGCTLTGFCQAGNKLDDINLSAGTWVSLGTFDTTSRKFPNVRVPFKCIAYKFVITCGSAAVPRNIFNGFVEYIFGLPDPAAR